MTREQLRLRYITAVSKHWRTSLDHAGPTPALLDDLVHIAEEHAREVGVITVKPADDYKPRPATPFAARTDPLDTTTEAPIPPGRSPTARTRTRPRRIDTP